MQPILDRIAPSQRFGAPIQPCAMVLFVVIVLLTTSAANALPVSARAYVRAGLDESTQPQIFSDGAYITNSAALSATGGFGSASARGAAGFGGVSAFIASDLSSRSSQSLGDLSWDDNWLMSPLDITLVGHQARVHPILNLTGSGTAQSVFNSYARASWSLVVRVGSTNTLIATGTWADTDGAGVTYTGHSLGQDIVGNGFLLPLGFATDVRFLLSATTNTACTASCTGFRSASVDLSNTLNWVGMVVNDSDAQSIGDFTLTSGSGIDYTQPVAPVPEPQTLLLVSGGLIALSARRKSS